MEHRDLAAAWVLAGPCGYGLCPPDWGTSSPCGRAISPPPPLVCVILPRRATGQQSLPELFHVKQLVVQAQRSASHRSASHRSASLRRFASLPRIGQCGAISHFATTAKLDRTTRSNDESGRSAGRPMTTSALALDGTTAARRMASCRSVQASSGCRPPPGAGLLLVPASCCWPTIATGRWPRLPLLIRWQSENGTSLGRVTDQARLG